MEGCSVQMERRTLEPSQMGRKEMAGWGRESGRVWREWWASPPWGWSSQRSWSFFFSFCLRSSRGNIAVGNLLLRHLGCSGSSEEEPWGAEMVPDTWPR